MDFTYINIKFYLLINIIFISNQGINKGIIKIKDGLTNPIIFDANAQNFNVISSGELFVIDKKQMKLNIKMIVKSLILLIYCIWIKQKIIFYQRMEIIIKLIKMNKMKLLVYLEILHLKLIFIILVILFKKILQIMMKKQMMSQFMEKMEGKFIFIISMKIDPIGLIMILKKIQKINTYLVNLLIKIYLYVHFILMVFLE